MEVLTEQKKYTSDEILFAWRAFAEKNWFPAHALILLMEIYYLYRLDKGATEDSSIFFTRTDMTGQMRVDRSVFIKSLNFLHQHKLINVLQRQQNNYVIYEVKWGEYISLHNINYRTSYQKYLRRETALAHVIKEEPLLEMEQIEVAELQNLEDPIPEAEAKFIEKLTPEWNDFLEVRKNKKRNINNKASTVLIRKLMEFSNNDIEHARKILNHSFTNNYHDIYEIKIYQPEEILKPKLKLKPVRNG